MTERIDRFIGSLVAGAVGDALGWPIEFKKDAAIEKEYGIYGPSQPGWQITDDTQMTLFGGEGILRARHAGKTSVTDINREMHASYYVWKRTQGGGYSNNYQGGAYQGIDYSDDNWWENYNTGRGREPRAEVAGIKRATSYRKPKHVEPVENAFDKLLKAHPSKLYDDKRLHASRAPGTTTMAALSGYASEANLGKAADNDSPGNGTVMRAAPIGLVMGDPTQAFALGYQNARLTHGRNDTRVAAGAQAMLVSLLVRGAAKYQAVHTVEDYLRDVIRPLVTVDKDIASVDDVIEALVRARKAKRRKAHIPAQFPMKFWGTDSLSTAVYALLKTDDLVTGLKIAVNNGGDSDTTGAIAGNLLGAYYGYGAIPYAWTEKVELTDVAAKMAVDLYNVAID